MFIGIKGVILRWIENRQARRVKQVYKLVLFSNLSINYERNVSDVYDVFHCFPFNSTVDIFFGYIYEITIPPRKHPITSTHPSHCNLHVYTRPNILQSKPFRPTNVLLTCMKTSILQKNAEAFRRMGPFPSNNRKWLPEALCKWPGTFRAISQLAGYKQLRIVRQTRCIFIMTVMMVTRATTCFKLEGMVYDGGVYFLNYLWYGKSGLGLYKV